MGARIGTIVALTTLLSYLHMFGTQRSDALERLGNYTSEFSQREQGIFLLAEDNHTVLLKALEERIRTLSPEDVSARFERLFGPLPDGTIRSRAELLNGTRMPGVFVPQGVTVDADLRRRILASYDVLAQYGPAFHTRFTNTYVMLPEGPLIVFWPEHPTFLLEVQPRFTPTKSNIFEVSRPENDPARKSVWTEAYFDRASQLPMVSVSTPLDLENRHVATIIHDVLLKQLLARVHQGNEPGAYNLLFRDDGQLITHPELTPRETNGKYNLLDTSKQQAKGARAPPGSAELRAHLLDIFERVRNRPAGESVLEFPEHAEYLAIGRIQGPGWNFVTVLPEHMVTMPAVQATRYVLLLGIASLLLELIIMFWVLRQQITRPLQAFTQATDQVATGDFHVSFKSSRDDELGRLAHGFELMAQEVQRREVALRQANEGLESRIQERTRELQEKNLELERALARLKEAQELLVQKEKLASLGAVTAGIAHEIKNPLNFVNNFAQLSVGLVEDLREELEAQGAGQDGTARKRVGELLEWLEQNVRKIDEHGRRADGIVRSMQLHSHARAGERTPTDLNALLEEHLGLASGGSRATHPGLEVTLRKELDPAVGRVDVVRQDFGRAILNLLDNSLYAVAEKKRSAGEGFTPEVTVSSRSTVTGVEIRIRDNGTGIPRKLQDKLFTPFFTTKPAGFGTGLGLSITYDIVVRQHRGELRVESTEDHFTECLIVLPLPEASR